MNNKSHPKVAFKWSRVSDGLLLSEIPDSQNMTSDTAKIQISEQTTK